MKSKARKRNRWKGFVLGMLGSAAGLAAMQVYQRRVGPAVKEALASGGSQPSGAAQSKPKQAAEQDDVSIMGPLYREGESSTAVIGRLMYTQVAGKEPSDETKSLLSWLVHLGYGMVAGGLYGALRADARRLDLTSAAMSGGLLWLVGDEVVVPLLGCRAGRARCRARST